jgi:hypothetical protein
MFPPLRPAAQRTLTSRPPACPLAASSLTSSWAMLATYLPKRGDGCDGRWGREATSDTTARRTSMRQRKGPTGAEPLRSCCLGRTRASNCRLRRRGRSSPMCAYLASRPSIHLAARASLRPSRCCARCTRCSASSRCCFRVMRRAILDLSRQNQC